MPSERVVCEFCGQAADHHWSDEGTHSLQAVRPAEVGEARCVLCGSGTVLPFSDAPEEE